MIEIAISIKETVDEQHPTNNNQQEKTADNNNPAIHQLANKQTKTNMPAVRSQQPLCVSGIGQRIGHRLNTD